jgi:hypothetical protein
MKTAVRPKSKEEQERAEDYKEVEVIMIMSSESVVQPDGNPRMSWFPLHHLREACRSTQTLSALPDGAYLEAGKRLS